MRWLTLILLFLPLALQGQSFGSSQGATTRIPSVDASTNTLNVISYEHHEIHSGSHYTFTVHDADADVNDTLGFIITTPNTTKWCHLVIDAAGALQTEVTLRESTTRGLGALQVDYNNNRNVSDTSQIVINAMANGGAVGTVIFQDHFGVDAGTGSQSVFGGGQSRGDSEWILKQNTKYLITVESLTDDNVVSLKLSFYEHTNK